MKKLLIEADILQLISSGSTELYIDGNTIITPAAMDKLRHADVKIVTQESNKVEDNNSTNSNLVKTIAIGSDHTGYTTKQIIIKYLSEKGYRIIDVGTNSTESCDYPDYALEVAKRRLNDECERGIMLDATGIPSAIVINKLPGIRAATCYNEFTAKSAREHNNACVLVLGAKALGEETIKTIVNTFLQTEFAGGRHQRRLDKITAIEQKLLNSNNS